jgi:plasmid stabilization system protein ParE
MAFKVEITESAAQDIDETIAYIQADSISASADWLDGIQTLMASLADNPARFPVIPEAIDLQLPYRNAVYFSHRVVFRIDQEQNIVNVVRVYHGARRPLKSDELQ